MCDSNIVSESIKQFIKQSLSDFEDSAFMCMEECERTNNYHLVTYWIPGIKDICLEYLEEKYKEHGDTLIDKVLEVYSAAKDLKKLEDKLHGKLEGSNKRALLAVEALASLVLAEYQKCKLWYTVYGCLEEDYCDLANGHHIVTAIDDIGTYEKFPVMRLDDITAAMAGVNVYVQSSSLYDTFAFWADKLGEKEQIGILEKREPSFNPDPFMIDAVICRAKRFNELRRNKEQGKNSDLIYYQDRLSLLERMDLPILNNLLKEFCMLDIIRKEYLQRFSKPPEGLPLDEQCFNIECDEVEGSEVFRVSFRIRGICRCENQWRGVFSKTYPIPETAEEMQDLIFDIAEDIKVCIAGKEKERNNDSSRSVEGMFPRKNSASHGLRFKDIPLSFAEAQGLYFIKKALRYSQNPCIHSSFGRDSTLVTHMLRKVTKEGFTVHNTDTGVEFREIVEFMDYLEDVWDLNIVQSRPEDYSFWDFNSEYGWNISDRKGNRSNGASKSEICCRKIKHEPAFLAIQKFGFDCGFTGLRGHESRNRMQAGLRDGAVYVSPSWNQLRVNPILFFDDSIVDQYMKKYSVPYSKLYDMILYDEDGNELFTPRSGCWACLLRGGIYLRWLRTFKPKQYQFLMKEKGLAKDLYYMALNLKDEVIKKKEESGQISLFDEEAKNRRTLSISEDVKWEDLEAILQARPCFFEKAAS